MRWHAVSRVIHVLLVRRCSFARSRHVYGSRVAMRVVRVLLRACRRVVSRVVALVNSHDVRSRRRSHISLFMRFDKIASSHRSG